MAPNLVQGSIQQGKLSLSWILTDEFIKHVVVEVGQDGLLGKNNRFFVLPRVEAVALDLGTGPWWFKVGSIVKSRVEWSGTYGPFVIGPGKPVVPSIPPVLKTYHIVPLTQGSRIHTNLTGRVWAIAQVCDDPAFPMDRIKSYLIKDEWSNSFEIMGLEPTVVYHCRLAELTELPTNSIVQLKEWVVVKNLKSTARTKPLTAGNKATRMEGATLLAEQKNQRRQFLSATDYAKYLIAKTELSGR